MDNNNILDLEDDAANSNWGASWRMPTDAEWAQLCDTENFTWSWDSTKKGFTVTSKIPGYIGNQIFLPATGYWEGTYLSDVGSGGGYWSSSLKAAYFAWHVYFYSDRVGRYGEYRSFGQSVRPVSD